MIPDYQKALQYLTKARQLSPKGTGVANLLTFTQVQLGNYEEALRWAGDEPDDNWRNLALVWAHEALGNQDESDAAFEKLLEKDPWHWTAAALVARGDLEGAMQQLERFPPFVQAVEFEPWFLPLHDHPRWPEFVAQLRHTEAELAEFEFSVHGVD